MKLITKTYEIKLKYPFGISHTRRTFTPIVIIELEHNGVIGYGEASLPPYLPETQQSVVKFLDSLQLKQFTNPVSEFNKILDYVNSAVPNNTHAKAGFDIALHDLTGKIRNVSVSELMGTSTLKNAVNSITIGIDTPEIIEKKVNEAADFKYLKIKLGSDNDNKIIETIRKITSKPIFVDANQGWKDKYYALDMVQMLEDKNTVLIEQPLPKNLKNETEWLSSYSKIPIIADESFQGLADLDEISNLYHGINIKLMKCTGLREANKIVQSARDKNLKILMGCMNESTCATMAGAHLASNCDWVDLDGPYLITNDPFKGFEMQNGEIILPKSPGLGIYPV